MIPLVVRNLAAPQTCVRASISLKSKTLACVINHSKVVSRETLKREWSSYQQLPNRDWKNKSSAPQSNVISLRAVTNHSSSSLLLRRFSQNQIHKKVSFGIFREKVLKSSLKTKLGITLGVTSFIGAGVLIYKKNPSEWVAKMEEFKNAILNEPLVAQLGMACFVGGLALIARKMYKERRSDLNIKIKIEEPPTILALRGFVQRFNTIKNTAKIDSKLNSEAFAHINHYRFMGNLTPRRDPHADIPLARVGLLTMSECEDFSIRQEAFKHLKMLLRQAFDPSESIVSLLILENRIGERLKQLNEVNDPITFLHEQVTCYNLILEKIFLGTLQAGSFISKDSKQEVCLRARAISKKLEKNPAFQYEAHNAKLLSEHLETPSQKVTESVSAIFAISSLYKETNADLHALLFEGTISLEGLEKLRQFLIKAPDQFEKAEQIYLRLKENWEERNTDLYASILLSKPQWHSSITDNSLQILQNVLKTTPRTQANWLALYRIVEVLSEIVLSNNNDQFRQKVFHEMTSLIDSEVAWQVRYKVASILLQLRNDPFFQDLAEAQWQRHLSLPVSNPRMQHSLRLFAAIQEKVKEANLERQATLHFKDKLKEKVDLMLQDLIPRDQFLGNIERQFHTSYAPTTVQIIHGMRGVGKTVLATTYAVKYVQDYTHVHWIDAKTYDMDLDKLADHANIPTVKSKAVKSLEERQPLLKKWLEEQQNHGWLLIIDNVDPEDCDKIKSFIPSSGGHILCTTYHDSIKDQFPLSLSLELSLFSPYEATRYLLQQSNCSSEDIPYVIQISEELGYLPLPLSHAKAFIRKTGCSFSHFLKLYNAHKTKLLPGLDITWDMNFEAVKKICPLTAELLPFLAHLYPHAIPYSLIETWCAKNHEKCNEVELLRALRELKEFALIGGANSVYSMHPFLQEVIKKRVYNLDVIPLLTLSIAFTAMKVDARHGRNWSIMESLIPQINYVIERDQSPISLEIKPLIYKTMSSYYIWWGDLFKAKEYAQKSLDAANDLYKGVENLEVADSLHEVAKVLNNMGDLSHAKIKFEKVLDIRRKIYKSDDHYSIADVLLALGSIKQGQGDLEGGKILYNEALTIYKKSNETEEDIANVLHQMGLIELLQGDLTSAKAKTDQALIIRRKIYKTDLHPFVASSLHQLSMILSNQGDLTTARKYCEQALDLKRKIYKTDEHPHVVTSIQNLGKIIHEQGDLANAKKYCEQALALKRKIYKNDEHRVVGNSLLLLGGVLTDQGNLEDAKVHFEQALVIYRKIFKTDEHLTVVAALYHLGSVLEILGDLEGAKLHFEQGLAAQRIVYKTNDHSDFNKAIESLSNLQKQIDEKALKMSTSK